MRNVWMAATAMAILCSCGDKAQEKPAATPQKPLSVTTAKVEERDRGTEYEATGTVRARTTGIVASRMNGYVQEVRVRQGDRVSAGQLLILLDSRDLDVSVRRAEAMRAEAAGMLPEIESSITAAKANLDLAEVTFRRMTDLYAKKSISNQEYDEADAKVKAARANYAMVQARRAPLQSRITQAEEERRSAGIQRDYTKIVAPFAGVVSERTVEPGNLATMGTPLLTIERGGGFRLEASVDESRLASLRPGQKVRYRLDLPGCDGAGTVDEIAPMLDPQSRSYLVKINLACAGLRSGMFGRAIFSTGTKRVLAIPAGALVTKGQLQSVFVVDDGAAHSRLVTLGDRTGDFVEVLSGVNAGESVITSAPSSLSDGAKVEVRH